MTHFHYQNNQLYVEQVKLQEIAKLYGTPTYIYSLSQLLANYQAFTQALSAQSHLICYSVKANSNIAVLNCLAKQGCGFDIVSLGELHRVLVAGGDAQKIVFSGVGKSVEDIRNALEIGIHCFNVESAQELDRIAQIAQEMNKIAPISIRVNPNVEANTHPYIATGLKMHKFGVDTQTALTLYQQAAGSKFLKIQGIDCHIGSQLTTLSPFLDALDEVLQLIDQLAAQGIAIHHLNLGGGLGICYQDETPPTIAAYAQALTQHLKNRDVHLILEPGRAMVANTGILLTKVEYIKQTSEKNFAIVDAGMNDLIRPSLYNAWHEILPVSQHQAAENIYDIVGPVCETGDFFARGRSMIIKDQDLLAIMNAGAYGFTMSSNYNSRPRAAEVMVDKHQVHLIRDRESYTDLFKHEHLF
jgi:diaminopimelate decarboxylase